MFEIVHTARLLPHEVARLLKVNRITVSLWLNGHRKPHRLLADTVNDLLDRIAAAVESGDLPINADVKRKDRTAIIDSVLTQDQPTSSGLA
jgi:hypothetical protein